MSEKEKGILILMSIVFAFSTIFLFGWIIINITDKDYTCSIYISEKFELISYNVSGNIKNRSDKTIYVDSVIIHIFGIKNNTK